MFHSTHRVLSIVFAMAFSMLLTDPLQAQQRRGRFRPFGGVSRVELATLDSVQTDLGLTDEQKQLLQSLNEQLRADRRALFQGGGGGKGNFGQLREDMAKLDSEATAKLNEQLSPEQQRRLTGLYVQANGTNALTDPAVQDALQIKDEQMEELRNAQQSLRQASFDTFRDFRNMSDEERQNAAAKLQKDADNKLKALLSEEQRTSFDQLQGEPLEMDLMQLRRGRGGGRRGGGGGNQGSENADRPQRPE